MAIPRFYIPDLCPGDSPLPEDQDHHARHVLRLRHGEEIIAFNGRGLWGRGTLVLERRESLFRLSGSLVQDIASSQTITAACAVPKADRAMTLVEQLSQIGVARLVWLHCRHSVVHPDAGGGKMLKFRRVAVESARQCQRNFVMDITAPVRLPDFLGNPGAGVTDMLWTDPDAGESLFNFIIKYKQTHTSNSSGKTDHPAQAAQTTAGPAILIGPEGGWSEEETVLLAAHPHVHAVRLTDTILRMETAAVVAAAILHCGLQGNETTDPK